MTCLPAFIGSSCIMEGKTCMASGFTWGLAHIQLWSPTCTDVDGEKADLGAHVRISLGGRLILAAATS